MAGKVLGENVYWGVNPETSRQLVLPEHEASRHRHLKRKYNHSVLGSVASYEIFIFLSLS